MEGKIRDILDKIGQTELGDVTLEQGLYKFTGSAVAKICRANGGIDYVGVEYSEALNQVCIIYDSSPKMGYLFRILEVYAYDNLGLIQENGDNPIGNYRTVNI